MVIKLPDHTNCNNYFYNFSEGFVNNCFLFQEAEHDKSKIKMVKLADDSKREKDEILSHKTSEIVELKTQLETEAARSSEIELQFKAQKQVMENVMAEKDKLQVRLGSDLL